MGVVHTSKTYTLMKTFILNAMAVVSLASCATGPSAQSGSVIGGLGGAAVGGIIGNQSGRGLEGAAIGAGLGALAGNAIGNSQDQRRWNNGYGPYNNGPYYNRPYSNGPYYNRPYYNPGPAYYPSAYRGY
jgi:outer membrane protein with glycine zipper